MIIKRVHGSCNSLLFYGFLTSAFLFAVSHSQTNETPQIKDVSAMCTTGGITASIIFDRPFSGMIYSLGYERVHECVYYNGILTESVLFSIPNERCGTRTTHNPQDVLETVENRVYVQFDKYTQTAVDKQFAFVCQQAYVAPKIYARSGNEIRRHPGSHLGKPIQPIAPIVGNRYQVLNWGTSPILPNYALDPNFGALRTAPQPVFAPTRIADFRPTVKSSQFYALSTPVPTNSVIEPQQTADSGPFFNRATTQVYGNRNSWSVVGRNQPLGLDDFMPAPITEESFRGSDNDADMMPTTKDHYTPKYLLAATTPKATSRTPIIAPNQANSVDTPFTKSETRLFANQQLDKISDSVRLEIQRGEGPFNQTISGAVKIGELITLTVQGKSASKGEDRYSMFVHSCYASDENSTLKIDLIDNNGCDVNAQVLKPMQRMKKDGQIIYFFPLKAFKFPGPSEVFFYCSVELAPDFNFPQMCVNKTSRRLRAVRGEDERWIEKTVGQNVIVNAPASAEFQRVEGTPDADSSSSSPTIIGAALGLLALIVAATATLLVLLYRYRKSHL